MKKIEKIYFLQFNSVNQWIAKKILSESFACL